MNTLPVMTFVYLSNNQGAGEVAPATDIAYMLKPWLLRGRDERFCF